MNLVCLISSVSTISSVISSFRLSCRLRCRYLTSCDHPRVDGVTGDVLSSRSHEKSIKIVWSRVTYSIGDGLALDFVQHGPLLVWSDWVIIFQYGVTTE